MGPRAQRGTPSNPRRAIRQVSSRVHHHRLRLGRPTWALQTDGEIFFRTFIQAAAEAQPLVDVVPLHGLAFATPAPSLPLWTSLSAAFTASLSGGARPYRPGHQKNLHHLTPTTWPEAYLVEKASEQVPDVPNMVPLGLCPGKGPPVPCPGRDIAFLKTAGHSSHRAHRHGRCSSPPPRLNRHPKPTSSSGLPRWMPTAACGALRSPLRRRMPAQFPALGEHRTRAGRALGVDGAELPRLGAGGGGSTTSFTGPPVKADHPSLLGDWRRSAGHRLFRQSYMKSYSLSPLSLSLSLSLSRLPSGSSVRLHLSWSHRAALSQSWSPWRGQSQYLRTMVRAGVRNIAQSGRQAGLGGHRWLRLALSWQIYRRDDRRLARGGGPPANAQAVLGRPSRRHASRLRGPMPPAPHLEPARLRGQGLAVSHHRLNSRRVGGRFPSWARKRHRARVRCC